MNTEKLYDSKNVVLLRQSGWFYEMINWLDLEKCFATKLVIVFYDLRKFTFSQRIVLLSRNGTFFLRGVHNNDRTTLQAIAYAEAFRRGWKCHYGNFERWVNWKNVCFSKTIVLFKQNNTSCEQMGWDYKSVSTLGLCAFCMNWEEPSK